MVIATVLVCAVVVLSIGYGISAAIRLLGRSVGEGAAARPTDDVARLKAEVRELRERVQELEAQRREQIK
jgi:hypothetical protein